MSLSEVPLYYNYIGDGNVTLKDYEASAEGIIQYSTEYRVRGDIYDSALETLWRNDRQYWN